MKLLLVGPYPPPHGGVSVHVRCLRQVMEQSGVPCKVLNIDPRAPQSDEYIRIRGGVGYLWKLVDHAWRGWILHVHTNGHNHKSWLVALAAAMAARIGPGCWLTLHSGMMPDYLNRTSRVRAAVARLTCRLSDRIICVNDEMRATIVHLGVPNDIEVKEAYLSTPVAAIDAPPKLEAWLREHSPLLTTTMFLRPEYGYEVLEAAMPILRRRYPKVGLLVMGIDGTATDPSIFRAGDVEHGLCLHLMSRSNAFVRPTFNDGDSVSVREARALGVPVVASDTGNRPPGTYLFRPGDVNGLAEQVEKVLEGIQAHRGDAVSGVGKAGPSGNESCEVA